MDSCLELKELKLSDIELGSADGEKESSNKNFNDYFYERHSDYSQIKNNYEKFMVTGKKGAGKTYLVKYLENKVQKESLLSKTIKWKDINLNTLVEFGKQSEESKCESFYRYIILIEIARLILGNNSIELLNKVKSPLKKFLLYIKKRKLKKFYEKRYPNGNYSIEKIKTRDKMSEKVDINSLLKGLINVGGNIESQNEQEIEFRVKNAFEIIKELEKNVFACLKYISIILISDDLDEQVINTLSDQHFKTFLINYINATNNLNLELKRFKSKVVIVIRDDILDALNYESSNINKVITDSTIQIDWCEKSRSKPWEYDISRMIINKIRVSARINKKITDKEIYLHFFGKEINNTTQIDYLISRSLGRPRDLIVYLNKIKEQYPNDKEFLPSHYRDALASYSKYFVDEFKNELRITYNNKKTEQIFNLLSEFNKNTFTFYDINSYYESNIQQYSEITDLKRVLSTLYKIGLLGNNNNGAISFYYRVDGRNKVSFNAKFIVHYGARKALIFQVKKEAKQYKIASPNLEYKTHGPN